MNSSHHRHWGHREADSFVRSGDCDLTRTFALRARLLWRQTCRRHGGFDLPPSPGKSKVHSPLRTLCLERSGWLNLCGQWCKLFRALRSKTRLVASMRPSPLAAKKGPTVVVWWDDGWSTRMDWVNPNVADPLQKRVRVRSAVGGFMNIPG